ncbi:hypothetical protein C2E25_15615 [Geothermobacter hydrogeniphilus]|uniref:Uncharacterized protein n=1 Tax=Geothermobacter hydrogeniphilus TaxID=1969733 RepID=A0A2K2H651_9BACT|nr:hypothetical protein [Geothermobacter hydrogeniphilus]PNU18804.1 hypothetical protein C2E25_15615 [Geothermobacter hydrogeniphilus]
MGFAIRMFSNREGGCGKESEKFKESLNGCGKEVEVVAGRVDTRFPTMHNLGTIPGLSIKWYYVPACIWGQV